MLLSLFKSSSKSKRPSRSSSSPSTRTRTTRTPSSSSTSPFSPFVISSSSPLFICLVICILSLSISSCAFAAEAESDTVTRAKCKEQVEEAIRQYFDPSKANQTQTPLDATGQTPVTFTTGEDGVESKTEGDQTQESTGQGEEPSTTTTTATDQSEEEEEEEEDHKPPHHVEDEEEEEEEGESLPKIVQSEEDEEEEEVAESPEKTEVTEEKTVEESQEEAPVSEEATETKEETAAAALESTEESAEEQVKEEPQKETEAKDESKPQSDKPSAPEASETTAATPEESASSEVNQSEENAQSSESQEEEPAPEEEPQEEHEYRSRSHIDDILKVHEISTKEEKMEQNLILSIFKDMKKIYQGAIKPLEDLYKYRDVSTRLVSDAEIFSKPMVVLLGGKSTGKTTLVNYLLGLQGTPYQLKAGTSLGSRFTVLSHGNEYVKLTPTELAADFQLSGLQIFGQHFLDHHVQAIKVPIDILQRLTVVDCPGVVDTNLVATMKSQVPESQRPKGVDNDVYQWFIDRSDVIYIVLDVNQLHLSHQLQTILEQLRGREVRFIINKADLVNHKQMVQLLGQLLWILSPMLPSDVPPQVYTLTTVAQPNYDPFLDDQEEQWLTDLYEQISGERRVESKIAALRRHAIRVRNHAKLVDCYLATFYKNKGLFQFGREAKKLANDITENPHQYRIFSGALSSSISSSSGSHNISRYDLPDPSVYREFFRVNPLMDFKPLSATCSFFRGCPMDKLDTAIAYKLPELLGKYRKLTKTKTSSSSPSATATKN